MHIKKINIFIVLGFVLLMSLVVSAVPLENWRQSFYNVASQYDNYKSSPSGLFWDDLNNDYCGIFDDLLWPHSSVYRVNHWLVEPALTFKASNQEFLSQKKYNFHFDALSDFKYGPLTVRLALDVDQEYKSDPYFPWMKAREQQDLLRRHIFNILVNMVLRGLVV